MILFDVQGNSREEVIQNMSDFLLQEKKIKSKSQFVEAVLEREKEITTGFGNGVAIPHGKSDTVLESSFVFAKLKNKVNWDALDNEPVDLVFLLSIEKDGGDENHLRLLSRVAVAIMDFDLVDQLRKTNNKDEISQILEKI